MPVLLSRLIGPLRRAAEVFFKREIAFVRSGNKSGGSDAPQAVRAEARTEAPQRAAKPGSKRGASSSKGGIRLVLQNRGVAVVAAKPRSRADRDAESEKLELALIRAQLASLLEQQPETRQTLRHLVFVEHALAKKGLRALHRLPLDVLQHALAQLEGLVTNWSPTGLASLRSRMAVAVIDREHMDPEAEADAYRTSAVLDASLLAPAAVADAATGRATAADDDAALAAAYAAMGHTPPAALDLVPELGSPSARAMAPHGFRTEPVETDLALRDLHH